ncbi:DUF397 domain-containing protein [Allonocardiopsis opalescens]|uniref:DUF397 domain-containing protein n=1 Tax=Allonocardiopsis opalescens TaxID=1144618 RepID=UPI003CCBFC83
MGSSKVSPARSGGTARSSWQANSERPGVRTSPATTTPGAALAFRDSKPPPQPHLTFHVAAWRAFAHAVRNDALYPHL